MGDFNDVLQNSIAGNSLTSPYDCLLQNGNVGLTLALSPTSGASTIHYNNVIDNQIVNKALLPYYIKGSIAIRKDISNVVKDFDNGKTSDHYPVSSSYVLQNVSFNKDEKPNAKSINPIPPVQPNSTGNFVQLTDNHFQDVVEVYVTERQENLQFVLYNQANKKVLSVHRKFIEASSPFLLRCKELPQGSYTLVVFSGNGKNVFQLTKD